MTWAEQLAAWAVDDVAETLRQEQVEHFANVRSWLHAVASTTPEYAAEEALDRWLRTHMNDGDPEGPEGPTLRDSLDYRKAFRVAMCAALDACADGCDADGYDPDDVTEAAIEAARATLSKPAA